jgi:hypothetical protein
VQNIAREALIFQQTLHATTVQTNLAISQAIDAAEINDNISKREENSRRATLEELNIDMKTMI